MLYESRKHPPIPLRSFLRRMATHTAVAFGVVVFSLAVGIAGYMHFEHLDWRDAFLNAAMLLGGMGPVDMPHSDHGKLFAAFFALYAGLVVLAVVSIVMAPVAHRHLHQFHWSDDESSRSR